MAVFNGSVNDIESKKNKTSSISSTPSDEKYPSEKAVKDYVDNNSGGGGISDEALNDKITEALSAWIDEYQPESKMDKLSEMEFGSEDYYPNCIAVKNYVEGQIGDIETALDSIIAIQNELMGVADTITFTIDEITCTAEEGMTWAEFCESEYNTINAEIFIDGESEIVQDSNGWIGHFVDGEGVIVSPTDTIIDEYSYYYV